MTQNDKEVHMKKLTPELYGPIALNNDYEDEVRKFKSEMLGYYVSLTINQLDSFNSDSEDQNFNFALNGVEDWLKDEKLWDIKHTLRTVKVFDDGGNELEEITVTAPETWSDQSVQIFANKYMYREPYINLNGVEIDRETDVRTTFERVCTFLERGCHMDDSTVRHYSQVLQHLLIAQVVCFNSPVLFNCGIQHPDEIRISKSTKPQTSACFILPVQDSIESIMDLAKTQAMLFKYGSGAGTDLSPLRSSKSSLSGGGKPSGPVSFMQVFDAVAGTIKSGGKTRRAALMMCLDAQHDDIDEFVFCKSNAEDIVRKLVAGGMDPQEAYGLMPYQNMNISVKVTEKHVNDDEFMNKVATAAWNCADPGLLFSDTINNDNTVESYGSINSTNPCGEFVSPDNTACNLASINLAKFLSRDKKYKNCFNFRMLFYVTRLLFYAQDSIIDMSSYPNDQIAYNSSFLRPVGLGVSNLGSVFMRCGMVYGDKASQSLTENILSVIQTACLCESAYPRSHAKSLLQRFGARKICLDTDKRWHIEESKIFVTGESMQDDVGKKMSEDIFFLTKHVRNSQFTLCAPTGTISFVMGCDTTGIEPEMVLRKYKHLVGGGMLTILNDSVREALGTLGYDEFDKHDIEAYIKEHGNVDGCDLLEQNHKDVFMCAMNPDKGGKTLSVDNHLAIMEAAQKHVSGAISKTVNLPESCTVQDIINTYRKAYKIGLKGITVYRDGCKSFQPVTTKAIKDDLPSVPVNEADIATPELLRKRMPETRKSITHKMRLGDVAGYVTVGKFDNGKPGEIFITMDKEGSALGGLANCFSIAVSMGLQYGIPLETFVKKFKNQTFGPSGWSSSGYHSSVVDYVFRFLENKFLKNEKQTIDNSKKDGIIDSMKNKSIGTCKRCGGSLQKAGSCSVCVDCGETTGCS